MISIKRMIAVLLCIVLAVSSLCACSQRKPTEEQTQPTTQETEKLVFHLDSLPDIGEKKDNSFVNKYWGGEAKNEFIPDENYKSIVPYVFSEQKYYTYSSELYYNEYSYGLATSEGEIITNGIYESAYSETSSTNKQVFICNESAEEEDGSNFVDIIAEDGSWKIRHKLPPYGRVSAGFDLITVTQDISSKVYDFDGNLIFDSQKLFGEGYTATLKSEIGDNIILQVSDGENYFAASIEDEDEFHNEVFAACVDRNGKIVYTVKPNNYQFSEVCGDYLEFTRHYTVYDEYGNSDYEFDNALFDKNGNKIIDGYDFIIYNETYDLYVLMPKDDKPVKVVDRNMKEVCQIETNGHTFDILVCNNEACLTVYYNSAADYKKTDKEGLYIYDLKTGKEIELPRDPENALFEMVQTYQYKGDEYILIGDGQYVGVYDATGKCLKKLTAPNIGAPDVDLDDDIFYYIADSKLYVETLDSCTTIDLKPDGRYSSYSKFSDGDLIYLTLEDLNSSTDYFRGAELYFVYNKSTGELKKISKVIAKFNTKNGTFTAQETDYYLNLLNENGECTIRKSKSF